VESESFCWSRSQSRSHFTETQRSRESESGVEFRDNKESELESESLFMRPKESGVGVVQYPTRLQSPVLNTCIITSRT
jgi:hypothetical protein